MTGEDGERGTWAVVEGDLERSAAEQVCAVLLDVLADRARWACVDAYSDYRDELPQPVEDAQGALRRRGSERGRRDPGMGVDIDRGDCAQEALLRAFAAWSIHVELLTEQDGEYLATFHDGASSVTAELTDAEADLVRRRLAGTATLAPLVQLHAAAAAERERSRLHRRALRRQRWSNPFARGRPGSRRSGPHES